jgi:hypothetical protein
MARGNNIGLTPLMLIGRALMQNPRFKLQTVHIF